MGNHCGGIGGNAYLAFFALQNKNVEDYFVGVANLRNAHYRTSARSIKLLPFFEGFV